MTDDHSINDDRLGDLIRSVVPDGPDPALRADAVVRRAHSANRRRGVASVAAVGAVALAVTAGPGLVDALDAPDHAAATGPSDDTSAAATALSHPFVCPTGRHRDARSTMATGDAVPDGAVLARICPARDNGRPPVAWTPPLDALTTNLPSVIDAYRRLPPAQPADYLCAPPRDRIYGFTLSFQYPDGRLVTLLDGNCDSMKIEGTPSIGREGASRVLAVYVAQLEGQRADRLPPPAALDQPLSCPQTAKAAVGGLLPPGQQLHLARAVLCTYAKAQDPERVPLSATEVVAINADYPRHLTLGGIGVCDSTPLKPAILVGMTAWRDDVSLIRGSCRDWSRDGRSWVPGVSAERAIDLALAR